MVAGIAAPTPSGIPGFNEGYIAQAGKGGTALNAVPLKSWYNIVINVLAAADSLSLPPAQGAVPIYVLNYSGRLPGTVANACTVFGGTTTDGNQDTIANATGVQGTAGVSVPSNAVAVFFPLVNQSGFSNDPAPGMWQYKILA